MSPSVLTGPSSREELRASPHGRGQGESVTAASLDIELGGRKLSIETGRIARQAGGAVVMRLGDTVVLVTACAQKKPREGVDFLPLTVDYRENTYAAGK